MRIRDVLTSEQRALFIFGYIEAGGYAGDVKAGTTRPWCAPWLLAAYRDIILDAATPYEAGRLWWESIRDEVESLLRITEEL